MSWQQSLTLSIIITGLQGVFAYYIISYSAVTYDDYEYPGWAEGMGLCISFSSMIWVPAYFVYYLVTGPGTIRYLMMT